MGRTTQTALVALVLVFGAGAQAQERFDPADTRMGVADYSTAAGVQPRVWLRTIDGRLVSRQPDTHTDAGSRAPRRT